MKKGFTLIEMLGILIILSVIILVSLPSLIQSNKNTKQAELDDNKQTIFMAAETYLEINKDAMANLKKNNYYYVQLVTLVEEGLLSSNLKNPGTNLEQTVVEGIWWVEARMNNNNINYSLVNENPYETETKDAERVYAVLIEKGDVVRDKFNNSVNRYVYTDSNPSNYVKFNNELWRIVSLEADKKIKIVRDDFYTDQNDATNFQMGTSNTINASTSLIVSLNGNYFNSMAPSAQNLITEGTFYTGAYNLGSLVADSNPVTIEKKASLKTKVGLLNPSDYVQASEDPECNIFSSYTNDSEDPCLMNNYLYKGARWWLMHSATSGNVVINEGSKVVEEDECSSATDSQFVKGGLNSFPSNCYAKVRPAVYLKADIYIVSGSGSNSDPYVFNSLS